MEMSIRAQFFLLKSVASTSQLAIGVVGDALGKTTLVAKVGTSVIACNVTSFQRYSFYNHCFMQNFQMLQLSLLDNFMIFLVLKLFIAMSLAEELSYSLISQVSIVLELIGPYILL